MKALLKKIMIWIMWYPLRSLINLLPKGLTYRLGAAGGRLLYFISKDKQQIMYQELAAVFRDRSPDELRKIVKQCFVNFVLSEMEILFYPSMDQRFIDDMVDIEGKEHLDQALMAGKGVLLFQAHFGAFQMVMPAIGYSGYVMNQISASASVWKEEGQSEVQKKSVDIKASYEYKLPVKHIAFTHNLKPVFSALKRNEIVGVTADGGGGRQIESVQFLGRKANFQSGGVKIGLKTGAQMVPVFILTLKNFQHKVIIHTPFKTDAAKPEEEIIAEALQSYADLLGGYVYQYPDHYGYTLYLRRSRAHIDPYLFFDDYGAELKK